MADEFDLIRRLFAPLATDPAALGLVDDAALLEVPAGRVLVATTDAIVAGVHFLPDDPPDSIARKLVRVNLSDLAAMGAEARAILLAACFPRDVAESWIAAFATGLGSDCRAFRVALLGGDTVATPGPATFAATALGFARKDAALRRSGAKAGDRVWVSGTIGDSAFGLMAARGERGLAPEHKAALAARYRLPEPRLALGQSLLGLASAAMDVSDGLIGDLEHICEASGVGAMVEAGRVPLSAAAAAAIEAGWGEGLATALTGGDDYELLFTAPPAAEARILELSTGLGLRLTAVGTIIAGSGVSVAGPGGHALSLRARGYRHFGA